MQHIDPLFMSLAFMLVLASATTIIMKWLKQPQVLGYVVAGVVATSLPFSLNTDSIAVWGEIGVTFMLFSLGLEFSFKKLKRVGGSGATAALAEGVVMMAIGNVIGQLIGLSTTSSLFLGGMISISSTSIIVKSFEELGLKSKGSSQIVYGVLIIEDLIAILLLVLLSSVAATNSFSGELLTQQILYLLVFLILWFTAGIFLIPSIFKRLGKWLGDETLMILSLALCFGSVVASVKAGFSPALGAFLMGAILAETDQSENIHRVIEPLRNLFAAIFFISVGMLVKLDIVADHIGTILILVGAILIIKPLAATLGLLLSGKDIKTSLASAMSLSQIGEFSFIIASLGLSTGVIEPSLYPIIVLVSIITTITTPTYITSSEKFYDYIYRTIPNSWKEVFDNLGSGRSTLNRENEWQELIKELGWRVVINLAWVASILFLTYKFTIPHIENICGKGWLTTLLLLLSTLALIAPFIYSISSGRSSQKLFKQLWEDEKYAKAPLMLVVLVRNLIAGAVVGGVIASFYHINIIVTIAIVLALVAVGVMNRNFREYHSFVEAHFLRNLNKTRRRSGISIPAHLTKTIYMEYFDIPIGSVMIGMSISELHNQYNPGTQVVTIIHNGCRTDLPTKETLFQAGDRVLVVGNDNQIDKFRAILETDMTINNSNCFVYDLNIYQITVGEKSPLCGARAHISALITNYNILLIGYERDGFNRPDPKITLRKDDTVWIVSEKENAKKLL